ncbi:MULTISPECIES: hypothetical protein [unclassified Streptomyces]|uniref:hypothetical protein n=1 Tax=unclassified Streptomyces TaxID=2593676 RepID=UPI00331FEE88
MPTDPYAVLQALLRAEASRARRTAEPPSAPAPEPTAEPTPAPSGPAPHREAPPR